MKQNILENVGTLTDIGERGKFTFADIQKFNFPILLLNDVQKGVLAREDREKIAYRLIDAYPKFSDLVKSQISNPNHIQRALRWVDAYSWYLKKMNMI